MVNDESPVDVLARSAAPPEDAVPLADTPTAEPVAAPARRSRRARSSRSRSKTTSLSAASDEPDTAANAADTSSASSTLPSTPEARAAEISLPEEPTSEAVPVEAGLAVPLPKSSPRPARPRRTARSRSHGGAAPMQDTAPALAESPPTTPEPVEAASIVPEAVALRETPVERILPSFEPPALTQAPAEAAESAAEAAPAEGRRRGGRRGRAAAKAPPVEEKADMAVPEAAPVAEPVPIMDAAQNTYGMCSAAQTSIAPPESATVVAPSRRARTTRKKTEGEVEEPRIAQVVMRRGLPELHIHGEAVAPVFFFGNVEGQKQSRRVISEIQRAAKAGIHIHSTLIELSCPLPPEDTVYDTLDSRMQLLYDADPQGYFLPRIVFVPAPGWQKQYPQEVNHYLDGTTDDPSIASDRFWQEAEHSLRALIEHIRRTSYGERIIGYHLERGEWFHPAEGGYDRSFANREAFRQWLRAKYKGSEVALRAAWYDGAVQFYTVEIPPFPTNPRQEVVFFEPRKERRWIDFLEYTSEVTADRLISLARVVKEATEHRALVSVCYGYTFEFGHTFSGHLALGRLLASPYIDLVAGPPTYRDRQAGGSGAPPCPVDSIAVHGKLWVSEDDTKTHLASNETPDDYNPRMEGRLSTEQVHLRAMGQAMVHQSAISWMDLWGEGWLDAEDVWSRIGAFATRYAAFLKHRRATSPEVVALIDERSLLHIQRGPDFVRRLLQEQRDALLRCGASVGFYLQSDVTARHFPTDARLYLFLTPYRLPEDQKAAIRERLQRDGKTLVWVYAVGLCDEFGEPTEGAHELVGIALRQQSWNTEVGSHIIDQRHPITANLPEKTLGVRERLNPSFYVDDDEPNLSILAEYTQTGLPSMAVREFPEWRSVFCGEPTLSAPLLRGLCRYAGAHLYTAGTEDYIYAGHNWLTVHSIRDGYRTFLVPPGCALYDLTESRLVGENLREYRTFVRGKATRCFYIGSLEEMYKIGLPGVEKPRSRRRTRAAEEPAVIEETGAAELTEEPAEGLAEAMEIVDRPLEREEDEEEGMEGEAISAEAAASAPNRRRRRRGGRRRRRSRPGEGSGPPASEPAPAAD